jgi:ankyrin repeat protein
MQSKNGFTPLHVALCAEKDVPMEKRVGIIDMLIKAGSTINMQNEKGQTPLHIAVYMENDVGIIQMLIDAGSDLNACNGNFETPLHMAVESGNVEIVCTLIDAASNIICRIKKGKHHCISLQN